mmetsp:Transcript_8342/g.17806  ORF Transcript_8342/g.17806 Transcript_8342/m.17806 type:complete len:356 (+) Transcript_8342:62-1129(+)
MATHPSAIVAAFLSVFIISFAPNVLLFLFPNYAASDPLENPGTRALLSLGQALAVGGLLGDVFLHTLPDCFGESIEIHVDHNNIHSGNHEDHHHHHHHGGEAIGLRVLAGFAAFFITDILVRSLEKKHGSGHSQSHSHSAFCDKEGRVCNPNGAPDKKKSDKIPESSGNKILSSPVLLSLIGDSLHNFTDGLAIGATFAATEISHNKISAFSLLKSKGGLASISVFLHEIPHELGDFATLVNAGLSRNMAIGAQFVTAIAAFLGTALGLFSGKIVDGLEHDVLLPFTAGGFIYLACVTILPEILESNASASLRLMQFASFLLGVGFMYLVAELEHMDASGNINYTTNNSNYVMEL